MSIATNLTAIAGLVFLTIILTFLGIQQLKAGEQQLIIRRMGKLFGERAREARGKSPASGRKILEMAGRLFTAKKITAGLDNELAKADIPLKGQEFLGLTLILVVGGGLFFTIVSANPLAGLLAMAIGGYLPYFFLKMALAKRLARFNGQIGDALVVMANSLRSGFSFLQAMDMVRREMPNPISKEFGIALQEMNWGTPIEEALTNMTARLNSEDLELVVTAVLIQRQVGGNLAEVLDNIANTIRERIRIKGEIKTLTAQGKISGLVIGLLPIFLTVILFFLNPSFISLLFTTKIGLAMVFMATVSQVIGLSIIRKIVNIEV